LLLIQVVTQPNEAESISIYNPTSSPIHLNNYYICDDEEYYKMQTEGDLSPSSSSSGFTARFPATLIDPFDTLVIVFNENYSNFYGTDFIPDLFLFGSDEFSMLETEAGSIGFGNNRIGEASELIILFYWDGYQNSLIKDVDYIIWGSYQNGINKTGIGDYLPDSAPSDQFINDFDIETYYAFSRTANSEISEFQSGGNGITGHDETSENFQQSWSLTLGCTDPSANNYNILAKIDDCNCEYSQPRIKLCTYNLLMFGDATSNTRIPYFNKIVTELCCDILAVQEIDNSGGADLFYDEVISQIDQEYIDAPFVNGPWTDNMLYYKAPVEFISTSQIYSSPRHINEYILSVENDTFIVYNLHLKAGNEAANESSRLAAVQELYNNINNNFPYVVLGDYNIYTSTESSFQYLIDDMQLIDPLGLSNWQYSQYAWAHTQSTRSSSGGLDDRFDMILVSDGINYLPETYNAFGNDGTLYNLSINNTSCAGPDACDTFTQSECEDDGNCSWKVNKAVRQEIADALFYASDHLPVTLDLIFTDNIQGDINIDGILNILDLVILANMVLAEEYIEIADMNYDGVLNVLDVVQLVNIILNN